MKKLFNIRGLASLLLACIAMIAFGAIFGFGAAAYGVTVAMAGVAVEGGTITQQGATGGAAGSDPDTQYLDMREVERKVELYKPYQTPLLTLLSDKANKGTVKSWEHKYYAVDVRGMVATISSATAFSSGVTTLTVDDSSLFTKYNTVYIPAIKTETTGISSGRGLVGIITGFPASNQITVKLLNPGTTLANTDLAGLVVYRGGSAHNERAASTTPWGILPEPDYNYVQIFMEQVEETEYQKLMKKEADWGLADLKRMAIEDFKMQRERTFLNGLRAETNITVDGRQDRFYFCGGFLNDTGIPVKANQTLASLEKSTVVGWIKDIFTGNNGANNRFFLGGSDMIEALEKIDVDNKWILAKETAVVNGIDMIKWRSHFGSLNVFYYEQLDLLGREKSAIVLDKDNIVISDLAGKEFNISPIDYKSSGIANVNAAKIEQASTMLIKNKTTHHIIEGV